MQYVVSGSEAATYYILFPLQPPAGAAAALQLAEAAGGEAGRGCFFSFASLLLLTLGHIYGSARINSFQQPQFDTLDS